jgi:hypothetical protein
MRLLLFLYRTLHLGRALALIAAILFLVAFHRASAQMCPQQNPPVSWRDSGGGPKSSAPRTLSGTIVYHDALRKWTGLRLDAPVCGQSEMQLYATGYSPSEMMRKERRIETLRGCKATVTDALWLGDPDYHSAAILQNADKVVPDPSCVPRPEFPELTTATVKPKRSIRIYKVRITVSLVGEGSIRAEARVASLRRLLAGWWLRRLCYLWGWLSGSEVSGTLATAPFKSYFAAIMDFGNLPANQAKRIYLTYTCTRVVPPETRSGPTDH